MISDCHALSTQAVPVWGNNRSGKLTINGTYSEVAQPQLKSQSQHDEDYPVQY